MPSPVFNASQQRQMTLPLDESLVSAHRSLRDCVASACTAAASSRWRQTWTCRRAT